MADPRRLTDHLNPPQLAAVTHGEGPLLILAGAGSGKTRVITHRIAWLVEVFGADPREIVAVTFTNKAAQEMRERAETLCGHELAGAYLGTFHALGLRLLRTHAADAGYPSSFVIYDTADQLAVARAALKEAGVDDKSLTPRQALSWISRAKNGMVSPDAALAAARFPHEKIYAAVYRIYEERKVRAGAADFDDLLLEPIRLFRRRPDIAERYAARWRFLLVDEFQDTNPPQYALIRLLTGLHRNLCCVGDEDQSIYGFRGADIRNILDFERDYKDAVIVKLEQNYRSTGNILAAAATVIRNNTNRHDKTLWTEAAPGPKVQLHHAADDRTEADFVVGEMLRRARESGVSLDRMALLYRTNATSRLFEDRLMARGMPYRVYGSVRFYERKEIKDVLSWLRLLVHRDADEDFLRAAQTPPRGLGATTLADLEQRAAADGSSLAAAASKALGTNDLTGRATAALSNFLGTLDDLRDLCRGISCAAAVTSLIEAIGYAAYLEKAHPEDHAARAEHLDALVSAAEEHDEAGAPDGLAGFLDRVSLRSDTDDAKGAGGPTLMTIHSAKGLEFDGVFIAGLNQDLFPHNLSTGSPEALEEERRLMYVALTRARRFLVLSQARFRHVFGKLTLSEPSQFLAEIPDRVLDETRDAVLEVQRADPFAAARAPRPERANLPWTRRTPPAGAGRAGDSERRVEYDDDTPAELRLKPGERIVHPQFGSGTILSRSGAGKSLTLDIRFDAAGRKRILPAYTALLPG